MSKKTENTGFICQNCGKEVLPIKKGTVRNHCPFCLFSLHVDIDIGDRQSPCKSLMAPVDVLYNPQKGWQILHQCLKCGFQRRNILSDDPSQPDDMSAVLSLMQTQHKKP